jgi:hypothetical protein
MMRWVTQPPTCFGSRFWHRDSEFRGDGAEDHDFGGDDLNVRREPQKKGLDILALTLFFGLGGPQPALLIPDSKANAT